MRGILFKAQRIDTKEWIEGYIIKYGFTGKEKWHIVPFYASDLYAFEIIPETICQYTGLTDKDGNKIWENDIVSHIKYSERKAKVVYGEFNCSCCNGVYGWTFENIGGYSEICDIRDCSSIEVISTIFDNPELLKGGNNE